MIRHALVAAALFAAVGPAAATTIPEPVTDFVFLSITPIQPVLSFSPVETIVPNPITSPWTPSAEHGPVQWSTAEGGNDHYYEYVGTQLDFSSALAAAANSTHLGVEGHLATATSLGENEFLLGLTNGDWSWLGGQQAGNDHAYEWVAGPEAGTSFYQSGPVSGVFNNFGAGEPDSLSEHGVHIGDQGEWNDLSTSSAIGYIVEYSIPPIAIVPVPAGGLLLLSALGVFGLRRRANR